MNIGIRSSSCTNKGESFTLNDLRYVKAVGFDIVELNFNDPNRCPSYEDGERWRKEAQRLSMRLLAHAPAQASISSLDANEVKSGIEAYRKFLDAVAAYGIGSVVLHACVRTEGVDLSRLDEHLVNLIHAVEELLPKCEEHGIRLMLETTVPGRPSSTMDNLVRVVDEIGSPLAGICLDTNHLNLTEDIERAVMKSAGRVGELHLNDNYGMTEEHLLPFDGTIDWHGFAQALMNAGVKGEMIMEPSWKRNEDAREMVIKAFVVANKLSALFQKQTLV